MVQAPLVNLSTLKKNNLKNQEGFMAERAKRLPDNVPGKYYVDENCIGCNLCVNTAPTVFAMNAQDKAYVQKQPEDSELADVRAALESCPVEAIGDDGT